MPLTNSTDRLADAAAVRLEELADAGTATRRVGLANIFAPRLDREVSDLPIFVKCETVFAGECLEPIMLVG